MERFTALIISLLITFSVGAVQADDHDETGMPVGVVYSLEVHDPQAFIASMAKYWDLSLIHI